MKRYLLSLFILLSANVFAQSTVLRAYDLDVKKKPKGDFVAYESFDGVVYFVGDIFNIGEPLSKKRFTYITEGDGLLVPIMQLSASASGQQVAITKISVGGNRRTGFYALLSCKGPTPLSDYSVQFEKGLVNGEIKLSDVLR